MKTLTINDTKKLDNSILNIMLLLAKESELMEANASCTYRYMHDNGKYYKLTLNFEEVEK